MQHKVKQIAIPLQADEQPFQFSSPELRMDILHRMHTV